MRHLPLILCLAGLFLLVVVASCNSGKDSGGEHIPNPMPVVQINPWPPPGLSPTDPVLLITISGTGSYVYKAGTAPSHSRVVVNSLDAAGAVVEYKTIAIDTSILSDGEHKIPIKDAADLIAKAKSLRFELSLNCQKGSDPMIVISDTEP
jgi:hypothetical protein